MIVYQCIGEPPEEDGNEWIYDDRVFRDQAAAEQRLDVLREDDEDDFYDFYFIELKLIE